MTPPELQCFDVDCSFGYLQQAVGWSGTLVLDVALLGRPVDFVARIHVDRIRQRHEVGIEGAVSDADLLSLWECPEYNSTHPAPVTIEGIVVRRFRNTREALLTARAWASFAPTLIWKHSASEEPGLDLECMYHSVGLASQHRIAVHPPKERSGRSRRRTIDRWIEEKLYERLELSDNDVPSDVLG